MHCILCLLILVLFLIFGCSRFSELANSARMAANTPDHISVTVNYSLFLGVGLSEDDASVCYCPNRLTKVAKW